VRLGSRRWRLSVGERATEYPQTNDHLSESCGVSTEDGGETKSGVGGMSGTRRAGGNAARDATRTAGRGGWAGWPGALARGAHVYPSWCGRLRVGLGRLMNVWQEDVKDGTSTAREGLTELLN
jgi:hypothetical protein